MRSPEVSIPFILFGGVVGLSISMLISTAIPNSQIFILGGLIGGIIGYIMSQNR